MTKFWEHNLATSLVEIVMIYPQPLRFIWCSIVEARVPKLCFLSTVNVRLHICFTSVYQLFHISF